MQIYALPVMIDLNNLLYKNGCVSNTLQDKQQWISEELGFGFALQIVGYAFLGDI